MTSFWQKMSSFCPFKVVLRLNCSNKSCFLWLLQSADLQTVKEISDRFYAAIYHMKYTSCFKSISFKSLANDYSSDERVKIIRKNTWHKTLVANNTIPSVDAMNLSSQRLKFVLENTSLLLQHTMTDPAKHCWIYESGSLKCV